MEGDAETRVAGIERGIRLDVARRDVVQHHDVSGNLLIAELRFPRDDRFDQVNAGLDLRNQGCEI
jgi:hypothetical protein